MLCKSLRLRPRLSRLCARWASQSSSSSSSTSMALWALLGGSLAGSAVLYYAFQGAQGRRGDLVVQPVPAAPALTVDGLQSILTSVKSRMGGGHGGTPYVDRGCFSSMKEEEEAVLADQVWAQYGEVSYDAVQQLLGELRLTKEDTFYDLGSGVGNVCLQVYLNSDAGVVKGLEFVNSRHECALKVSQEAQARFPAAFQEGQRTLSFLRGNILHQSFGDATVIFMCSWCMDDPLLAHVARCATNNARLRYLVTLRPLPADTGPMGSSLTLWKTVDLQCDWHPTPIPTYIYQPRRVIHLDTPTPTPPTDSRYDPILAQDKARADYLPPPEGASSPSRTGPELTPPAEAPTGGLSIYDPRLKDLPIAVNSFHARV